jgi:hypothetical protein
VKQADNAVNLKKVKFFYDAHSSNQLRYTSLRICTIYLGQVNKKRGIDFLLKVKLITAIIIIIILYKK